MKKPVALFAAFVLVLQAADTPPAPEVYKPAERRHWSFQARKDVKAPAIQSSWIRTPIDAFVLQKLQAAELSPAPTADRATLIRRATYDLTGLPPTPAEVDAFLSDKSANAWDKVIDRLLASPHYGEQWGRKWLDVVRFAESDGYEYDLHRPDAWRYRDYVVHAFNSDKPYNEFVTEQLAGDEIKPGNEITEVASGFNRLGSLRKNAGNQEVASSRNEVLTEMTNVVGAAFLGVTLGCARCHDHKFDPIRHTDYYRMQGYFAQAVPHDIVLASEEEQKNYKTVAEPIQREMRKMNFQIAKAEGDVKTQLEKKLEELEDKMPPPLTALYSVKDDREKPTPIHVLARGEYTNKGAKVGMRPLGVLVPETLPELPIETDKPRARLAEWITDPSHPLTARVMVNRIWQGHFGRGIVATANDFGRMGSRPSHPELLDWLANDFVANGWKIKRLHKTIMLSSAYMQSSASPQAAAFAEKDPENALLWQFNRRRLDAEELRDSLLSVAGRLKEKAGGPSIMLPIDRDLVLLLKRPNLWSATRDKSEYDRRSLYLINKRNLRLPFMEVFDMPDMMFSCARREQSTHAPQALELLNGQTSNEMAEALAQRLLKEAKTNEARVDYAFRLTTGRPATPKERARSLQYLAESATDPMALREFALSILNLNAFLYVN